MTVDVEALYERYGPMVHRRCRGLLRDEELAVEAMQDTFVAVLRRRDSLEVTAASSLLYRIATNTCLNLIRSRSRRSEDANHDLIERIASAPDAESGSVASLLLERVFSREQPSTRTIAVMHLVDGFTLEEVAAEVGMSVSGVRKRLRTLKQHVGEIDGLEGLES